MEPGAISLKASGRGRRRLMVNRVAEGSAFAYQVWTGGDWFNRVNGTAPMDPANNAEALLFMVTRPREQMIDVMHGRSFITAPLGTPPPPMPDFPA